MEKQQTAVEFLIQELRKNRIVIPMEMEQQAKEMFEEQINNAHYEGSENYRRQYYNETFKSE
jgi:hypothetical protein